MVNHEWLEVKSYQVPFFVSSNTTDFYTTRHITGELLQGSRSRSAGNFRKPGMRGMVEWLRWRVQDPPCKVVWKNHTVGSGLWWIFRWEKQEEDDCSDPATLQLCKRVLSPHGSSSEAFHEQLANDARRAP